MAVRDGGNTAAFGPIGPGGTERTIANPVVRWLVSFGGHLFGGHSTPAGE